MTHVIQREEVKLSPNLKINAPSCRNPVQRTYSTLQNWALRKDHRTSNL